MFRAGVWGCTALVVTFVLLGCAKRGQLAPVDDHVIGGNRNAAALMPGAENAGKPGYYTVRSGDTLIRISMDNGQSLRDIIRWNKLDNPNLIEVGQVLRVVPQPTEVSATRSSTSNASAVATPGKTVASAPDAMEESLSFQWPARGNLLASFDEAKNKGFDIAGKAGDPVLASADGRVVYAGSGLRGYGNLIILKHNNTYLTAYAHNQSLLVKDDQVVKRGQKIAEMGSSDADQVKLHFEIRRQGKPVDPAKYLPTN